MQAAVDAQDGAKFDAAFDSLSAACTACHAASGHGFLVIQRPRTPILDNLRAEPVAGE
jgi:cytochrome c553